MAEPSLTEGFSQKDRRIISSWPISPSVVCTKCEAFVHASNPSDPAHRQWACLPCNDITYSITPRFRHTNALAA